MKDITITSRIRNYPVKFRADLSFLAGLKALKPSVFIIDKKINELYRRWLSDLSHKRLIILEAKEECKDIETATYIFERLLQYNAKRNLILIAIGGGIIQDIAGFAASTLYRGILWIYAPTTFLAQVDSCIGSKTSLNFKNYKNLVGTFYPPTEIYICPKFLKTLTEGDFYSGVGEYAKFLLMNSERTKDIGKIAKELEDLRDLRVSGEESLLLSAVAKGLAIKKPYIEEDEFDLGVRNLLNYGHEFGHALEAVSNYYIPHGTAVILGMLFANSIAHSRKLLSQKVFGQVTDEVLLPNLPRDLKLKPSFFEPDQLLEKIKKDKKRTGEPLVTILPKNDTFSLFKAQDVTAEEFFQSLALLVNILKERRFLVNE